MNWRPIETAPRDGTIIDVWLGDAEPADVRFYCDEGTKRSAGWWFKNGKFRPLGGLEPAMPVFVEPTHWMPLPEPPEEQNKAGTVETSPAKVETACETDDKTTR